jgi:hypothetical protein
VNYIVQIDINTASRRQKDGGGLFVAKRDWRVSGCFHKVNERLSNLYINHIKRYTDKKEKKISSYIRKFRMEQLQSHI